MDKYVKNLKVGGKDYKYYDLAALKDPRYGKVSFEFYNGVI